MHVKIRITYTMYLFNLAIQNVKKYNIIISHNIYLCVSDVSALISTTGLPIKFR